MYNVKETLHEEIGEIVLVKVTYYDNFGYIRELINYESEVKTTATTQLMWPTNRAGMRINV